MRYDGAVQKDKYGIIENKQITNIEYITGKITQI